MILAVLNNHKIMSFSFLKGVINMTDHTPEDVEKIVEKAKREEREAKKAKKVVDEAVNSLDERRNNSDS